MICAGSPELLAKFVARQVDTFFPVEHDSGAVQAILDFIDPALRRVRPIVDSVKSFESNKFNHLHSLQYTIFLYCLGREIYLTSPTSQLVDRLFCLNRSLNCIDLHPAVKMPDIFFISHGLSSVLGNAEYRGRIVIFQNVTVGRIGDRRPTLGCDVILYPGSSVTGRTNIGDNCVVSAGTPVHNLDIPNNSIVELVAGSISIRPLKRDYISLYFK